MKNNNIKHTFPFFLGIFVALVFGGAYAFVFITIEGYVTRIGNAVQESETLTRRDAMARSTEAFLNSTKKERDTLEQFIVHNNDEVVTAIELLERAAKSRKVALSISSVSIVATPEWSGYERVAVLFSATGPFTNLTRFIATLEALPIASRIESGSLEISSGTSWFGSFAITFIKEKI